MARPFEREGERRHRRHEEHDARVEPDGAVQVHVEGAALELRAEFERRLQRLESGRPPHGEPARHHDQRDDEAHASADELGHVGVAHETQAVQPLREPEEAAPAILLSEDGAVAGADVHALHVREAHDGRAESALEDLDLLDLRARARLLGACDELVQAEPGAARGHLAQLAFGERLQLRAKDHREPGCREEHGDQANREPGPAMNREDGVAYREIHLRETRARP